MRIVIDMQGIQNGSRLRGIGRYTNSLVKQLIVEAGRQHEIFLVLNGAFADAIATIRTDYGSLLPQSHIHVWQALTPTSYLDSANDGRRLASEAIREAHIAALQPDVVLISSMVEGAGDNTVTSVASLARHLPTAVIFYDLIPLLYPKEYLADSRVRSWYMSKLEWFQRADLLLAISESSRLEALQHLAMKASRVVNISAALDPDFLTITPQNRDYLGQRFGIERPYLLYSGASDPRKNLPRLVSAYARLASPLRAGHQMVLAGGMPSNHKTMLQTLASAFGCDKGEIIFAGHVSDQELVTLYAHAKGLVFPSYHEGFGLPILEAMQFCIPVIGANTSSVPEVIGNPAALFDPFSEQAITNAIERLLTDDVYRASLASHSRLQREQFSWQASARQALAALVATFGAKNKKTSQSGVPLPELIAQVAHGLQQTSLAEGDLLQAAVAIDRALPRNAPPYRLYVDISELHVRDSGTGVQRVVRNILTELLLAPPQDFEVLPVFATMTDGYKVARQWLAKFHHRDPDDVENETLDPRPGDLFLGLDLNHHIAPLHATQLQSLRNQGVRVAFVIYDLLPITLPHLFWDEMTKNHRQLLKALSSFDDMLCISRSVADELKTWLASEGLLTSHGPRVAWFHLGANLDTDIRNSAVPLDPAKNKSVLDPIAARPSFLMVGTLEPRKGHAQVVSAFEQLWAQGVDINLVIVGKQGWNMEALTEKLMNHPEQGQRLFWLSESDDACLEQIYATADCLITASEGEGFGLPLIEAAQHGLPILARDIPVFREVAGAYAQYFHGPAPSTLAEAILDWLALYRSGQHPQSENMPWLTWRQSTEQLLSLLSTPDISPSQ